MTPNKPTGAWDSEEDYLRDQYALLREDAVRPLRDAVALVREYPRRKEADFSNQVGIYDRVSVKGFTFATRGVAVRVSFSTNKIEKNIQWDMSKRLLTGSVVALTPAKDMFQKHCIVAIVAARPLSNLARSPPELDLYFADNSDLNVEAHEDYVMIEGRNGFYEAHRHTMKTLQHMSQESFPLSKYLVFAESQVGAPNSPEGDGRGLDLSGLSSSLPVLLPDIEADTQNSPSAVEILGHWPAINTKLFDPSQQAALCRIMTKELAIIQGPPGTGKTYVSVAAVKALLKNTPRGGPPIIISCQTNHALDQILHQIAEFEPEYARLGGFSKNLDIKQRTLYYLRDSVKRTKIIGDLRVPAIKQMEALAKELKEDLAALDPECNVLHPTQLLKKGLISHGQYESLEKGAEGWVQRSENVLSPLELWLGKELVPAPGTKGANFKIFDEVEDPETEMEELKDNEAENMAREDDEFESLNGPYVCVAHSKTAKKLAVPATQENYFNRLFRAKDLWKIPQGYRGHVYRGWLDSYKRLMSESLQTVAESMVRPALQRRIGGWERDLLILQKQRVIGMTTTGLSKNRALITALQPQIILIEEAGESLEGSVTSACLPSIQQLILVGDHQQLRPQCHVQFHGPTLNMSISLFERLINNNVEYEVMTRQRRMIPEIRRLLRPIYGDILEDHVVVTQEENRPPVKGMGDINSFFLDHEWFETKDPDQSFVNYQEAKMVAGLFDYLCRSGESVNKITVLTFYNGQRKEIERLIRTSGRHLTQINAKLEVRTVDSYQGEEKDIIILALARHGSDIIGFVSNINRICVAMSRARRGLYILGNHDLLRSKSGTWAQILDILAGKAGEVEEIPQDTPCRVGPAFPITCAMHQKRTWVTGKLSCVLLMHTSKQV